MPTSQNGQTHSNNSSATANKVVFDHFVWLVLKGLIVVVMLIGISNDMIVYVEDSQSHEQKKASLNVLQNS